MRAEINAQERNRSKAVFKPGQGVLHPSFPLWLKIGFWSCMTIAVAVVIRRATALLGARNQAAPPQLVQLDAYFASQAALTWVHILCALAFVSLLPFLFWHRTQNSSWLERAFLILGLMVGATAYAMSMHAVGGWLERSAVLLFNTLFLVSLARIFVLARRGEIVGKRRWTLRAVAILLGIATTRPVMGVFFATSRLTHLTPAEFFGLAFWIGFSINTVAIELWLRRSTFAAEWLGV
jgi:hypothetical protein